MGILADRREIKERETLEKICRLVGVDSGEAELVHYNANAMIIVPSWGLALRARPSGSPEMLEEIRASVKVCRWLGEKGFPTSRPMKIEPFAQDGWTISFWFLEHLKREKDQQPTGGELGKILKELHQLPAPPFEVPSLQDPFFSVKQAIEEVSETVFASGHREWLSGRIKQLSEDWQEWEEQKSVKPDLEYGLIHGDPHPNNLMRTVEGKVLMGDWDKVRLGSRVWDLMQIIYFRDRFDLGAEDVDEFMRAYGHDFREWEGLELCLRVREVSGLGSLIRKAASDPFAQFELSWRVMTLMDERTKAKWNLSGDLNESRSRIEKRHPKIATELAF
ncbi:MAG: phosphotransferase family protein [Candidatus Dormibacteraceae bacterium]